MADGASSVMAELGAPAIAGHETCGPRWTNPHMKAGSVARRDGGERREPLTITTKSCAKCLKRTGHVDKVFDEARGSLLRVSVGHVTLIHP